MLLLEFIRTVSCRQHCTARERGSRRGRWRRHGRGHRHGVERAKHHIGRRSRVDRNCTLAGRTTAGKRRRHRRRRCRQRTSTISGEWCRSGGHRAKGGKAKCDRFRIRIGRKRRRGSASGWLGRSRARKRCGRVGRCRRGGSGKGGLRQRLRLRGRRGRGRDAGKRHGVECARHAHAHGHRARRRRCARCAHRRRMRGQRSCHRNRLLLQWQLLRLQLLLQLLLNGRGRIRGSDGTRRILSSGGRLRRAHRRQRECRRAQRRRTRSLRCCARTRQEATARSRRQGEGIGHGWKGKWCVRCVP
jgi:hypothetical protein